jgi:hypothetical protein
MKNILALIIAFTISYLVSDREPSKAAEITKIPVQRFVPLNAERSKNDMLWSGFFALDTETGQLCRTVAEVELYNASVYLAKLPSCVSLSRAASVPNSGFQKF